MKHICDDMSDVPMSERKQDMWPQEYRSQLFSLMLRRYVITNSIFDMIDEDVMLLQDTRPIYMHLIGRAEHKHFIEKVKGYIITNYGK